MTRQRDRNAHRHGQRQVHLEMLEDRCLLSGLSVFANLPLPALPIVSPAASALVAAVNAGAPGEGDVTAARQIDVVVGGIALTSSLSPAALQLEFDADLNAVGAMIGLEGGSEPAAQVGFDFSLGDADDGEGNLFSMTVNLELGGGNGVPGQANGNALAAAGSSANLVDTSFAGGAAGEFQAAGTALGREVADTSAGGPADAARIESDPAPQAIAEADLYLSAEDSGLLSGSAPFDIRSLERALQQFFHWLDDVGQELASWWSGLGIPPWALIALATAAAAGEIARRNLRKQRQRFVDWPLAHSPPEGT